MSFARRVERRGKRRSDDCQGFLTIGPEHNITFFHVPDQHVVAGCGELRERPSVYCRLHRAALTAWKARGRPASFMFQSHYVIGGAP